MSEPLLRIERLRTWFRGEEGVARAVDGVTLEVMKGETLGLVGESGCGKTVTALSVMGLLPGTAGIEDGSSIRFRGEELVGASDDRLRRLRGNEISMVFQEPMSSLNPVYPVGDQIGEALRLHRGMGRADARREAARLLAEVEIAESERRLDAYPHQLSGGMRQRVMIAMALACEPEILIADEPTTALDVTVQAQILALLAELRARRGMAVLLVTHDLGVVAEVCDRVAVMYAGQMVETATAREIFEAPAHPYTRGLLDSLPRVSDPGRRLTPIPGSVPEPARWSAGCRFRPRCAHAATGCDAEQEVTARPTGAGTVRCHRAGELTRVGRPE